MIRNKPTVTYISKVPYTINKSGRYELVKNFDCGEKILSPCITINADNVTLDLKGFKVFSSNQDLNRTTYGIWSQEHSHVTITNGEVEGFFMGILLQDVSHNGDYYPEFGFHEISNISVKDNTFRGIRVEGVNNTVTNNIVANTGGTTVFEDEFSIGIESIGSNCLIENNRIVETYATDNGESVGISLTSLGDSQILNYFVFN